MGKCSKRSSRLLGCTSICGSGQDCGPQDSRLRPVQVLRICGISKEPPRCTYLAKTSRLYAEACRTGSECRASGARSRIPKSRRALLGKSLVDKSASLRERLQGWTIRRFQSPHSPKRPHLRLPRAR